MAEDGGTPAGAGFCEPPLNETAVACGNDTSRFDIFLVDHLIGSR